ncbi:M28 family metallopeptidase [Nonomuraea ceibae]|uniref:M28 family metallopeptidase n=1 Tax=Nonomuraea ceibae TaxID=1935170 RepID=UPI001C5CF44C|nr:M28 family peptidase [Nonomuraea ceibae]
MTSTARRAVDRVSAARMRATVHELAADRYAGRRVGTPGGRAAAAWLAARLRELGGDVRLDGFPVADVRDLYATPVLEWHDGGTTRLRHRRDFAEHLASADLPTPRTAPLAPSADGDLRGRWVPAEPGDWARACDLAEAQGAAGVLIARGADAEGWMPKMIAGPPTRGVPILAVRADLHRRLADTAAERLVQVTASTPLRRLDTHGLNVHAHFPRDGKPGTHAGSPWTTDDEPGAYAGSPRTTGGEPGPHVLGPGGGVGVRVLLTAHYDGVGDDPGARLPAAADNASGVAAVLEAARVLSTSPAASRVELSVAFLDGEEAGARGSAHHAATLPEDTLVINLDGAAELHQAASVEAGGPAHALLATLDQAGRLTGAPLRAGAMASDNRRYAAAGLPAVGIGMGMPGYQTPAETPDRVRNDTLLAAARLLVATVELLARRG